MKPFSIVVAIDRAGGIGREGKLPWNLPADMARFKEITQGEGGNAVIMGRKTWDSIPEKFQPLPGRLNVVLTRRQDWEAPEGAAAAGNFEDALRAGEDATEVFVIGGGAVYEEALRHPDCRTVHMTAIHEEFGCDTFFLPDATQWELESESETVEENGIPFSFCVYRRKG